MWAWCIAAALSPALLLLFLVHRRRLLERQPQGKPQTAPAKETVKERRFAEVIVTTVLLLALLPPAAMRCRRRRKSVGANKHGKATAALRDDAALRRSVPFHLVSNLG
jgi:hypothetical protein